MKNQETCFVLDTNLIANELFDSIHLSIESLIEYLRGYMSYSLYPVEIECIITVVEKQLKEKRRGHRTDFSLILSVWN